MCFMKTTFGPSNDYAQAHTNIMLKWWGVCANVEGCYYASMDINNQERFQWLK